MNEILVVEKRDIIRQILLASDLSRNCLIEQAPTASAAKKMMQRRKYSLVITENRRPEIIGIEVITGAQDIDPSIPVIFFEETGNDISKAEALEAGAEGFIPGIAFKEKLLNRVKELLGISVADQGNFTSDLQKIKTSSDMKIPEIVGEDLSSQDVLQKIKKVAPTSATVLLQGESGTGKELYAKAIHLLSKRKDGPFMAINCAAIPGNLLENELFGHEKGAYTDAVSRKLGKFEVVDGGTIFLDEIAELDPSLQAKLLRVLQEKEIEPIGSAGPVKVDVRIICATNRDIKQEIRTERFRSDLYFRISVFPIFIVPLRNREKDIPIIAEHYLKRFSQNMLKENLSLSDESMKRLQNYSWPGNVRELEHCVERAVILAEGDIILPEHLHLPIEPVVEQNETASFQELVPLNRTLAESKNEAMKWAEKFCLKTAIKEAGGDLEKAAKNLDIPLDALISLMKEYE